MKKFIWWNANNGLNKFPLDLHMSLLTIEVIRCLCISELRIHNFIFPAIQKKGGKKKKKRKRVVNAFIWTLALGSISSSIFATQWNQWRAMSELKTHQLTNKEQISVIRWSTWTKSSDLATTRHLSAFMDRRSRIQILFFINATQCGFLLNPGSIVIYSPSMI